MNSYRSFTILITIILISLLNTHAQTNKEYFATEGLSINSFQQIEWNTWSYSYSFLRIVTSCGVEKLEFIDNQRGYKQYLSFDDKRVFSHDSQEDCEGELLYDFSLNIGDTFKIERDWVVIDKYEITLLNGDKRMRLDLESGARKISWIEGIGNITEGLFSRHHKFRYFSCAKIKNTLIWVSDDFESTLKCEELSCLKPVVQVSTYLDSLTLHLSGQFISTETILWDFGDGNTSIEKFPTHEYERPGCYTLTVYANNDCHEDTVELTKTIPVCVNSPWFEDYSIDTLITFSAYVFSDQLEFIHKFDKLWRSTDGGNTWVQAKIPPPPQDVRRMRITDLEMFDAQRGVLTMGHSHSTSEGIPAVFITQDGGKNWNEKLFSSYFMLDVEVSNDGKAWASGPYGRYFRSFDYGETWEQLNLDGIFEIYNIQFMNDSLLVGYGYSWVQPWGHYLAITSTDNGKSWSHVEVPEYINEILFLNDTIAYGWNYEGELSKTKDGGETWNKLPLPFSVKHYSFSDPDTAWLVDQNNLIYYTSDGLNTFSVGNCGGERINDIQAQSGTEAFALSDIPGGHPYMGEQKIIYTGDYVTDCSLIDNDGDGYTINEDCNDSIPGINPGATEIPNNGIDENCDGLDGTTSASTEMITDIRVYPNPASERLQLYFPNRRPAAFTVKIYNLSGQLLLSSRNNTTLDLSELNNGMYILTLENEVAKERSNKRIVISN